MRYFWPSLLACGTASIAALSQTGPASGPPRPSNLVVVELFTSQGCSSCPPADAYLEELAKQPNVIAISRPVTYWDRLGWKDSLAREENTNLQRAYAARGFDLSRVYTPQMVVQGAAGAVGSDRAKVRTLIAKADAASAPSITIGNGKLTISGKAGGMTDVKLLALQSQKIVRIGRGENGGRVVRYNNVVLNETRIGQWNGGATTLAINAAQLQRPSADRYIVLVQKPNAGPILAAKTL